MLLLHSTAATAFSVASAHVSAWCTLSTTLRPPSCTHHMQHHVSHATALLTSHSFQYPNTAKSSPLLPVTRLLQPVCNSTLIACLYSVVLL